MVGGGWWGQRSLSCRQYSSVTAPATHIYTEFPETLELPSPKSKAISVQTPSRSPHSSGPSACFSLSLLWVIIGGCKTLFVGEGAGMLSRHPFDNFLSPSRKQESG